MQPWVSLMVKAAPDPRPWFAQDSANSWEGVAVMWSSDRSWRSLTAAMAPWRAPVEGEEAPVVFDTVEGHCPVSPALLERWLALSPRLAVSDDLPTAVAARLRVLSTRIADRLGAERSGVRVAVLPAEQEAFCLSLGQARARAALPHRPQWRCRTCRRRVPDPVPPTTVGGTAATPPRASGLDVSLTAGWGEAAAWLRARVHDVTGPLTGVVRDAVPCAGCGGHDRVQTPEPCCPADGAVLTRDLLEDCPACGRSVFAGPVAWLQETTPVPLERRELATALDAAEPQEPLVVVHDDEAGLLSPAEQKEILQVAVLLATLPPARQPQPLTTLLVPFAQRLIAHLLVPACGPRLLTVSAAEKQLLVAVHILVAARAETESRRVLICVGCGSARPDDRDARRRQQDEARKGALVASAAAAALMSAITASPMPLAMLGRNLLATGRTATQTPCPTCADLTAVCAVVPVCPRCLAVVRVPASEQCPCGHRFGLAALPDPLFGPCADRPFWADLGAEPRRPHRLAVVDRVPRERPEPLLRSVDGTLWIDGDLLVLRNGLGEVGLPLGAVRDVVLLEPDGAAPGWLRLVTATDLTPGPGHPCPTASTARLHQERFALLVDPPQLPAARGLQARLQSSHAPVR